VLRKIFGLKREEVVGGWRILHNEELHNLYVSSNITRVIKLERMGWMGHVVRIGEVKNVYKTSVRKSEGKRPLERPNITWEYHIRMGVR